MCHYGLAGSYILGRLQIQVLGLYDRLQTTVLDLYPSRPPPSSKYWPGDCSQIHDGKLVSQVTSRAYFLNTRWGFGFKITVLGIVCKYTTEDWFHNYNPGDSFQIHNGDSVSELQTQGFCKYTWGGIGLSTAVPG